MSTLRLLVEIELSGDPDHATVTKYRNGLMNAVREMDDREGFIPESASGDLLNLDDVRVGIA